MTRVVVVDDHPVFRKGLAALLRAGGFDVCGEAGTGREATAECLRLRPDVVLMDLGLPDGSGVTATAHVTAALPAVRVLVISQYDDEESVTAALDAGAAGYVLKESGPEQILAAVAAIGMGAQWLGSGVPRPAGAAPVATPDIAGLTPRESAIAELVGKGLANPAIAERLGLSAKTVANYVSAVVLKLGAADRREAIRILRSR